MKIELESHDVDSIGHTLARVVIDHLNAEIKGQRAGLEDVLTVEELSQLIKVKPRQIYAWVNESKYVQGGIPFLKAGKFLRFSRRDVLEWMKRIDKTNPGGKEVIKNAGRNSKERKQLLRVSVDRPKEKMVLGSRKLQTKSRNDLK
jgi:excisionase family DNA binding protein